jgi:hypothetical protein
MTDGLGRYSPNPNRPIPLVPLCFSQNAKHSFHEPEYFGKIGWAMEHPDLGKSPKRAVLESMPHKSAFDNLRSNVFTKGTGYFSHHLDARYGIDLDAFQTLDIRTLR